MRSSDADLIKIDLLELPNLACTWASVSYEHKTYFKLIFPLFVIVMMSIPVAVAWCNSKVPPGPYMTIRSPQAHASGNGSPLARESVALAAWVHGHVIA